VTAWFHVLTVAIAELCRGSPGEDLQAVAQTIPELKFAVEQTIKRAKKSYRYVFDPEERCALRPDGFDEQAIFGELQDAINASEEVVSKLRPALEKLSGGHGRDFVSALEAAKPRLPQMRYM
jgi:hypothetical protein